MIKSSIFQRGLATTSGAAAVTLAGWWGETSASRTTSRVASKAVERWQSSSTSSTSSFSSGRVFSLSGASRSFASTTSKPANQSKSFVQWYEGHLEARPILTKSVTGSILWGIGDVVAQVFPHLSDGSLDRLQYDWMRTGRAVTFGGVIHAPTSHLHFNFLEWMTVRSGFTGLQIPIFKTFMEQVCIIVHILCFFVFTLFLCLWVKKHGRDGIKRAEERWLLDSHLFLLSWSPVFFF